MHMQNLIHTHMSMYIHWLILITYSQMWWCMPLIPALGRQRQVDFWVWGQPAGLQSEFRTAKAAQRNSVLKKKMYSW